LDWNWLATEANAGSLLMQMTFVAF